MSSNEPQVEQQRQPRIETWADCLQRMAAVCGGTTRPSAGCCRGASDQQQTPSQEPRPDPSCSCGTTQPGAAESGPEMV
jgi:hypothetical protein